MSGHILSGSRYWCRTLPDARRRPIALTLRIETEEADCSDDFATRPTRPMSPPLLAALAIAVYPSSLVEARADDKVEFNRDVRPILSETCFQCHGPDSLPARKAASLRLDKREAAIEAGAIEPGKPDLSELIDRVNSTDPKQVMPPPAINKTLTAEQKATLKRWVEQGAEYQPHWSFIAPKQPTALARMVEGRRVGEESDRPVRAGTKLEAKELKPAAPRPIAALWPDASASDPDRWPSADARPTSRLSSTTRRRIISRNSSTSSSPRRDGASTAPATGSTRPATPTRTAFTSTTIARCGRSATGSSRPSTRTCRSIEFTIEARLAGDPSLPNKEA